MISLRKHILLCAIILPLAVSAQTATEVVNSFLKKVNQQTLTSSFALIRQEAHNQPFSTKGNIHMRGARFLLDMQDIEAAYDGHTYYLYQDDINELTLSLPTKEELLEANPLLFASALLKQSMVRFSANNKDQSLWVVELLPNNKSAGIDRFVLTLRKKELTPISIELREGQTLTKIRFLESYYTADQPTFEIIKKEAYLNDMR